MAYLGTDYSQSNQPGKSERQMLPPEAKLDLTNNFAKDCIGAFIFNENGGAPKNYAQPNRRATLSSSGWKREITYGGRALSLDGINGIVDYNCHRDLNCPNGFSVSAYCYIDPSIGYEIVNSGSFVSGQGWGVRLINNVGQPTMSVLLREPADKDSPFNPSTLYQVGGTYSGPNLFNGTNSWFTGTYTPERDLKVYANTRLMATLSLASGTRTVNGAGSVGWCSGRNSNFTGSADQPNRLYAVFIHERPLTTPEVEALHSDYRQFFWWPGKENRYEIDSYGLNGLTDALIAPFRERVS